MENTLTPQIDYENEVRKVYPDAICKSCSLLFKTFYIWKPNFGRITNGDSRTEKLAWQSAYNSIKKQLIIQQGIAISSTDKM